MRYAWEEGFLEGEDVGRIARLLLPPLLAPPAPAGPRAARRARTCSSPTRRHVAERIERYYGRTAEVVNPPVDVEHFLSLEREPADYYLAFGRVVPYKRVDIAVAACAAAGAG